jgi:hypothetical protein
MPEDVIWECLLDGRYKVMVTRTGPYRGEWSIRYVIKCWTGRTWVSPTELSLDRTWMTSPIGNEGQSSLLTSWVPPDC